MLMAEESACPSLPDITDLVLQQPQQESWASIDHQFCNGEQEAIVWGETELQISQERETDELRRDTAEEAEQWEPMIWPVRPMSCTSPPISFATVQWDMPDPTAKASALMTDGSAGHELDSGSVTTLDTTSPSFHPSEGVDVDLFTQEVTEEEDGEDSQFLNSDQERTGNCSEPCDAADVQEPTAQEQEDSTHELLDSNNEAPLPTDSEENGHSATADPAETVDLIDILEEIDGSEDEADSFVDLKPEEELEEPGVVLTGQEDSEEEQAPLNSVESEEEKEEGSKIEEEQSVTSVSCTEESDEEKTDSLRSEVEVPADELQSDDSGPTVNPDELIDLQQSELSEEGQQSGREEDVKILERLHEDPTELTAEPEMCKNVDQNVDPEQPQAARDTEEQFQAESDEERIESSQETLELTEKLEETSLQHQDCDQTTSGELQPEQSESEHLELSAEPEEIQVEEEHSEDAEPEEIQVEEEHSEDAEPEEIQVEEEHSEDQSGQHPKESPQMELSAEPEQIQVEEEHSEDQSGQHLEESPLMELSAEPEQIQVEEEHSEDQSGQHLEESPQMELAEEPTQPENADQPEESTPSERTDCIEAEDPVVAEQQEQMEPSEQSEQTTGSSQPALSEQLEHPGEIDESEITEQLSAETEVTQQTAEAEFSEVDKQAETPHQAEGAGRSEAGSVQTVLTNGEQPKPPETAVSLMNGGEVDREKARRLAERLFKLDGIQRVDVVKHLDKDNDFSHAVGEEYLKFFDFTGQTLDHALRSFLKVVVLIGETQERERVLQHFACRFHQCNPDSFSSSGAVLALTCALMLLNTDLHGQNVGKSMSSSKFVSNLDGMNEGENFGKDLLKSLYNSIKSEPLEWAVDEEELKSSVLVDEDAADDAPLRSKANPFQDVPHDKTAAVVKEGFLQRKLHADIDGKRTPWGKRGWKTFYGGLRGMVLYLQKDDYRRDQMTSEEVVSVHHSLTEQAADYTKRPHVFRLQTADLRVFLFQASSRVEMNSWISRINLVSALHSSPPFPAAVGSQRRFFRPILPASQSAHTLERQLQSHMRMMESFKADLSHHQQNQPEGKKAKARDLEEHRLRAEYLHHEMCRYELYIQALEAWKGIKKTDNDGMSNASLSLFDKAMCPDSAGDEEEGEGLKKSYSSPSLELEMPTPTVIKVRRNISERRTYRKTIIPRFNKEA